MHGSAGAEIQRTIYIVTVLCPPARSWVSCQGSALLRRGGHNSLVGLHTRRRMNMQEHMKACSHACTYTDTHCVTHMSIESTLHVSDNDPMGLSGVRLQKYLPCYNPCFTGPHAPRDAVHSYLLSHNNGHKSADCILEVELSASCHPLPCTHPPLRG